MADAEKITITYDDGTTKDLEKGLVFHLHDIPGDGHIEVTADLIGMSGKDLFTVVTAAVELGMKLGMFSDKEDTDDE